jgi:hypothetical protein
VGVCNFLIGTCCRRPPNVAGMYADSYYSEVTGGDAPNRELRMFIIGKYNHVTSFDGSTSEFDLGHNWLADSIYSSEADRR